MGSNEYYYRAVGDKIFIMSRRTFFGRRDRDEKKKAVVRKLFKEREFCEMCDNKKHSTHVFEKDGLYFVICEECAHSMTVNSILPNKKSQKTGLKNKNEDIAV